jgi:molecular chaperone DnaK (HSP70)
LKQIAEERLKMPVTEAVITIPADFNHNQREATRDAA